MIFLSKKVISSYGNYSNTQLRRLENALCHDNFEEKQRLIHIKNSLDSQIEEFNKKYNLSSRDRIDIFIDEKNEELCLNINIEKYNVSKFNSIYSELSNTLKNYNKLNKRNNKKMMYI